MIDKRITVDTVMGPASTIGESLREAIDTSLGRNYDCEIDNEFKFDYKRECVRMFKYIKRGQ